MYDERAVQSYEKYLYNQLYEDKGNCTLNEQEERDFYEETGTTPCNYHKSCSRCPWHGEEEYEETEETEAEY